MGDQAGEIDAGIRCFVRIRPERNEWRWYGIAWGPMLFGSWGVVLSWGRLGSSGRRRKVLEFASAEEAMGAADAQVRRRLRRGYVMRP